MIKIPTGEERKKLSAGGYVCKVVKATNGVNRYDEPCILLYLDVSEGEFKNYFGNIYKQRLERGEKAYPCVYCQLVGKYSARHFKRFIENFEQSNVGYFCTGKLGDDWDERELEGLQIGVVFGEKEFFNARDKRRIHLVPRTLMTVDEIRRGNFTLPTKVRV